MGVAVHDVMLGCGGVTVRPVSEWASRLPPAVNRGNVPELPGFYKLFRLIPWRKPELTCRDPRRHGWELDSIPA